MSFILPQKDESFSRIYKKEVEYMGLNFSKARFIGSQHFISERLIKNEYLDYWNEYVIQNYSRNNLNNLLDLEEIINRNSICHKSYQYIDESNLVINRNHRIRQDEVQECIDELEYESKDKIGICFVVESFDFFKESVSIWFTLVNMKNNRVIFQRKLSTSVRRGDVKQMWARGITTYIMKSLAPSIKAWK